MNLSEMSFPSPEEYGEYYQKYIDKVDDMPLMFQDQVAYVEDLIANHNDKLDIAYAPGKWTLRQLLMHIIETEMIFLYRMLRISRGDQTPLMGFDQEDFVNNTSYDHITPEVILELLKNNRAILASFVSSLTKEQSERKGTASENPLSVRAACYIIVGHFNHHKSIIETRYL